MIKYTKFTKESTSVKTLGVMTITAATKLVGFLRTALIASIYGASWQTDAFNMAASILHILTGPTQSINSAIIPTRIKLIAEEEKEKADRIISALLNVIIVISLAMGCVLFFCAPQAVKLFAPNLTGETYELTVIISRLFTLLMVFTAMSEFFTGLLNAHKNFIAPKIAALLSSATWLLLPFFLAFYIGIYAMVLGYMVGIVVQTFFMVPKLRRVFRYAFNWKWKDKRIFDTLYLCIPVFIGTFSGSINQMINKALASNLQEGSISAIQYATQLTALVTGIIVLPISTSVLTSFTEYVQAGDFIEMKRLLRRALNVISVLILPITAYSLLMPYDIVRIVFQRGAFNDSATQLTQTAFQFFALGMFPQAVSSVVIRCFYAFRDTKSPLTASLTGIGVSITLNFILVRFMGLGGLALATSVSATIIAVLCVIILRRKIGKIGFSQSANEFLKIVVATTALAVTILLIKPILPFSFLINLFAAIFISGLVYLAVLWFLKCSEISILVRIIKNYHAR